MQKSWPAFMIDHNSALLHEDLRSAELYAVTDKDPAIFTRQEAE